MAMERSVFREYLEALIIAAIFLQFANHFVLQTFYIPSGSMENTLLVGDHLFVNRFIYGAEPPALAKILPARTVNRGDIVIFRSPENPTIDVVKRCIGLPGDVIEVVSKQLYINGKAVRDASYAVHKDPNLYPSRAYLPETYRNRDNYGPYTVPQGHYFCMGDNRDNSWDSRFWGSLPAEMLKGRAMFIYWSYGGGTESGNWQGMGDKLRDLGRTAVGFLPATRWRRTFRLIR
ncbi:MAG TPA: signal peptidase I [Thermoanaerobaculia bacterium]|nr:signal peptidase I [Thermoanaerobaculia bacterium]